MVCFRGLAFLLVTVTLCMLVHAEEYENCVDLDPATGFSLQWTVDLTSKTVSFNVSQANLGWMGIGLAVSDPGTMGPGYFYTAWNRQDGSTVLQDRFLTNATDGLPELDPHPTTQQVSGAASAEGSQWVAFQRLLDTGNPHDINLEKQQKVVLLHAWGVLPDGNDPSYHGPNRGKQALDIFASSKCAPSKCPNDCSEHGACVNGACNCSAGWTSPDCSLHDLSDIKLPPGFKISYFASNLTNVRTITESIQTPGLYFAGSWSVGNLYALKDVDLDGVVDTHVLIASGLTYPNGVAYANGTLFVSCANRIIGFMGIDETYDKSPEPYILVDDIPTANGDWHGWKFLRAHPQDGYLYFTIGSPCNYCLNLSTPGDPVTKLHFPWGSIARVSADGSGDGLELLAHGIRDSQGFDWHPHTGDIWFSDNGRDNMGANKPWDELNRIPVDSMSEPLHFGFPFCYGLSPTPSATGGPDPLFYNGTCEPACGYEPAAFNLGPHVAALGVEFYRGSMFPAEYQGGNTMFIAYHGSWNRAPGTLTGYKVVTVYLDASGTQVLKQEDFATGWLNAARDQKWGRPVSTHQLQDGSLLITDDFSGAIYRVTYS